MVWNFSGIFWMKDSIFFKALLQDRIFATNIVFQLQGSKEILYTLDSILLVLKAALLMRLSLLNPN